MITYLSHFNYYYHSQKKKTRWEWLTDPSDAIHTVSTRYSLFVLIFCRGNVQHLLSVDFLYVWMTRISLSTVNTFPSMTWFRTGMSWWRRSEWHFSTAVGWRSTSLKVSENGSPAQTSNNSNKIRLIRTLQTANLNCLSTVLVAVHLFSPFSSPHPVKNTPSSNLRYLNMWK